MAVSRTDAESVPGKAVWDRVIPKMEYQGSVPTEDAAMRRVSATPLAVLNGQRLHDPVSLRSYSRRGRGASSPEHAGRRPAEAYASYVEAARRPRTTGCAAPRPRR